MALRRAASQRLAMPLVNGRWGPTGWASAAGTAGAIGASAGASVGSAGGRTWSSHARPMTVASRTKGAGAGMISAYMRTVWGRCVRRDGQQIGVRVERVEAVPGSRGEGRVRERPRL